MYCLCMVMCMELRGHPQVLNYTSALFDVGSPSSVHQPGCSVNFGEFSCLHILSSCQSARIIYWLPCLAFIWFPGTQTQASLHGKCFTHWSIFPAQRCVQFIKPPSSALQLSTFHYWASGWAHPIYLWSATQMFPSLMVLTTSAWPWVLLFLLLGG